MKNVTIQDIADLAGVSKTTVSFVLNDTGNKNKIKEETRQKVLNVANELNYRPNFFAKSLKSKKSNTIGFLVADISNIFYSKIGRIIEDIAWVNGYKVLSGSTDESEAKEEALIRDMVGRQIDGLIIAPANPNSQLIKQLANDGFPLVIFDRDTEILNVNSILIENKLLMKSSVEQLIKKGKRRIALFTITPNVYTLKLRIEGYKAALNEHKIPIDENLILEIDIKRIKESTSEQLKKLLTQNVDSIVFTNNQSAGEVFWCMKNLYQSWFKSLEFATFDNLDLYDHLPVNITSIAQPVEKIATKSINLLLNNIKGEDEKQKIYLNAEIIKRN